MTATQHTEDAMHAECGMHAECTMQALQVSVYNMQEMLGMLNVVCMLSVQCNLCRYLFGQHTPRWHWLSFFAIQGPLVAVERCSTKILLSYGITVPRWVSVPLTLSILLLTANRLFFSVWYETPFANRMNASLQNDVHRLATLLQLS